VRRFVELDRQAGEIWQVVFSHDGTRLASAGKDGTAVIYEVGSFDVIHVLSDHDSGVCSLSWSPDDTLLVTGSTDKHARIWNSAVSFLYESISGMVILTS